jgi:phosphonate transport system substrate-binding protein
MRFFFPLIFFAAALSPAQADDHLVMGVFPRFNAGETMTRYTPLAESLGKRLNQKVTVVTSKDFQSFWRGVEEQRYDLVQYNQYQYIRSASTYQVIAHNKEFGKSTIAGVIYVRRDSGIADLKQLRGRTILFGGSEDAMIGYIAPVYLLLQAGLTKSDFKSIFAVNPLNSVIGVFHKQADAAGSGDIVIEQPAIRNAIDSSQLTALAVSEQLLHLPWAVRRGMPAKQRESIRSTLVNLENSEEGRKDLRAALLSGIGKADDKDYEPHRRMVRAVLGPL